MPFIVYVNGSPLFHFAIMIERVLATVYVKIYENQGKIFGIISSIIAVKLNFKFYYFLILVDFGFYPLSLQLYYNTNGYRHIRSSNGLSNTDN